MSTSIQTGLGPQPQKENQDINRIIQYINVKLSVLGAPIYGNKPDSKFLHIAQPLIKNHQEKSRLLLNYYCPADFRIKEFLDSYLAGVKCKFPVRLPVNTFSLDRAGLSRMLSLAPDKDEFISSMVETYRVKQGILHNPKNDKRTTKGVFHITEGGLPIPDDKKAVPKEVFANLFGYALQSPDELSLLPFTSSQKEKAHIFVSLLLRPTVCPEIEGIIPKKSMEIRFFAPGSLVGNLDFVESIFGNAGDPYLPENDSALDIDHWTGHTGCVILAPHLVKLRKKDLGLPHWKEATERQRRDGMCWKNPTERYNDGAAFKITCRDERGVMVTIIADNYFGYCKKEVKTQISYSANLYGLAEEEHAGGALAFQSYILGQEYSMGKFLETGHKTFKDVVNTLKNSIEVKPQGYAIDKKFPDIYFVPANAKFHVREQSVSWTNKKQKVRIPLLAGKYYVLPSGYKIHIEKQLGGPAWRLIGTVPEGTLCHKPCTVSGGGKSEISKSIADAMIQGPVFIKDFNKDLEYAAEIINRDFSKIFKNKKKYDLRAHRPLLSEDRTLGSVIKLFTPSNDYTQEHNNWINSIPNTIRQFIFVIKRYYRPEWGNNWKKNFHVDQVNGHLGHELKYRDHKLVANYLRVGRQKDGSWRVYKLRPDYHFAEKVQFEDDITASVVFPAHSLNYLNSDYTNQSVKLVTNCEYKLFQRPDDAIIRGYDKQGEADLATPNTFLSNYEPLNEKKAKELVERIVEFDQYTAPMKNLIQTFRSGDDPKYFISSAHPRLVDGKPTKNPRYLQNRPDLVSLRETYLADVGIRVKRGVPIGKPIYYPVNAVLAGRRNNPPDEKLGIPALAVYNPIHYQELPELFLDFICSLTGKSPSTTGFGSEGALTKGPFNALPPVIDLNNALLSFILTGYAGFTSAAGYVGPNVKVDHDISLLVPEIWSRMNPDERDPKFLIKEGLLEKLDDFRYKGKLVPAGILGYRITQKFSKHYLGRMFETPAAIFTDEMLKPETQNMELFVQGIENIIDGHKRISQNYFRDGSIEGAIPPLKALLTIMATGKFEGKTLTHPKIRFLFTRSETMKSEWYKERLKIKQTKEIALWEKFNTYLRSFRAEPSHAENIAPLKIDEKIRQVEKHLKWVKSTAYLKSLVGTIGADPLKTGNTNQKKIDLKMKVLASKK